MHKQLKIILPVVDVLAIIGVLVWEKMAIAERILIFYAVPAREIILNVNLPIAIIWWPIIHTLEWLGDYSPFLRKPSPILTFIAAAMLLASVGFFWYFLVTEFQMRRHGESIVRFTNKITEFFKVALLFCCGIGTFFYAFKEAMRPSQHGLSHYGLWPVEIVVSVLLVVAWGAIFVGMAISDLKILATNKHREASR